MKFTLALLAFVLVRLCLASELQSGDDDSADANNDYVYEGAQSSDSYDDETDDLNEEPQPSILPRFTTEAQTFMVAKGRLIKLPCRVDKLGPTVISWKKLDSLGQNYHFLVTGNHKHTNDDRISVVEQNEQGSTLLIQMAVESDSGDYICEVSSNPPATLRHHVTLIHPPTVEILKPTSGSPFKLKKGDELALVCHGHGDPMPTITWKREKKRMPDGRNSVEGSEIIFKDVTRKHSGTYICEGSNGSGMSVNDSISVEVLHPPEIVAEQNTVRQTEGIQLELVCIVHASPTPVVHWYRDGTRLINDAADSSRVKIGHIGRKHILSVMNYSEDVDSGIYTCHAINDIGEAKENLKVLPEEMSDERTSHSMISNYNADYSSAAASAAAAAAAGSSTRTMSTSMLQTASVITSVIALLYTRSSCL